MRPVLTLPWPAMHTPPQPIVESMCVCATVEPVGFGTCLARPRNGRPRGGRWAWWGCVVCGVWCVCVTVFVVDRGLPTGLRGQGYCYCHWQRLPVLPPATGIVCQRLRPLRRPLPVMLISAGMSHGGLGYWASTGLVPRVLPKLKNSDRNQESGIDSGFGPARSQFLVPVRTQTVTTLGPG